MEIFKRYTSAELLSMLRSCCKRFPVTVVFILLFTAFLIAFSHHGEIVSKSFNATCIFYLSTTILLSFSLHLWCEEIRNFKAKIIIQSAVHLLWIVCAIYLYKRMSVAIDITLAMDYASAVAVIVLSIFILSFLREANDIAAWNFTLRLILSVLIVTFIGLVIAGGINLLLLSFEELFHLDVSNEVYADVLIICMAFIATMLFLGLVPAGTKKHDQHLFTMNRFGHVVVYYLFLPLLASYIITLYVYALQILFTWTLPTGWVSWLVTASMAGLLLIIALIYPTQFTDTKRTVRFVMRILPLILLPLLVLMTIGIIRRFNDYGLTVSRLYLLLFNLWCYAVCIALFLLRSRRILWIPASFGIILLLSSTGPLSMANVTRKTLVHEVTALMAKNNVRHPMNVEEYTKAMTTLDTVSARCINDKIAYLKDLYQEKTWNVLVDSNVVVNAMLLPSEEEKMSATDCGNMDDEPVMIPAGYSQVLNAEAYNLIPVSDVRGDTIILKVSYILNEKKMETTFPVSIQKMKELSHTDRGLQTWQLNSREGCLSVRHFTCKRTDRERISLSMDGLLFLK